MTTSIRSQLLEMGFHSDQVNQVILKYPTDVERCANDLMGLIDDDQPPPVIQVDQPLPPPPPPAYDFGQVYDERWELYDSKNPTIDLTTTSPTLPLFPHPETSASLNKAIEASLSTAGNKEDTEIHKALEASLVSISSVVVGADEFGEASSRIRTDGRPPILRSLSPHFSGLAAYLQSLYAIPTWRRAILQFRPSEDELFPDTPCRGYEGYWRGLEVEGEGEGRWRGNEGLRRIISLQRLFSIMELTGRRFLHTTEVERVLEVREWDWKFGGEWVFKIKEFHEQVVGDFLSCETERLTVELSEGRIGQEEFRLGVIRAKKYFEGAGRQVIDNSFIASPLPNDDPSPFTMFVLNPLTHLDKPDTLYAALDRQLITTSKSTSTTPTTTDPDLIITSPPTTTTSEEGERSLSLVVSLPDSLAFNFINTDEEGINLNLEVKGIELPKEIWLDRYAVKNRGKISKLRERERELKALGEEAKEGRKKLTVTKEGKDAVEMIRDVLGYLKEADSEDVERRNRQKVLAHNYSIYLDKIVTKAAEYDKQIAAVEAETANLFEGPTFKTKGPYDLVSFVVRNGLGGRGNAYSVVRGYDNKWWKISDLSQEEVDLDEALKDKTGLFLKAGILCAFYQLDLKKSLMTVPEPPIFLQEQVEIDNQRLAAELQPPIPSTPPPTDIFNEDAEEGSRNIDPALLGEIRPQLEVEEESDQVMDSGALSDEEMGNIPSDSEEVLRLRGG